MSTVGTLA
jgi:hypothetical protein